MSRTATTRSARARAQRPQLVPRDTTQALKVAPSDDLDARQVRDRGTDPGEWQSPGNETVIEPEPDAGLVQAPMSTPQPAPQPNAAPTPIASLELRQVTYEDLDRLWDWVRGDAEGARRFLPAVPANSHELTIFLRKMLEAENAGTALIRSIDIGNAAHRQHIGFIALNPISRTPRLVGVVHCYLAPLAQGSLPQLLPHLLDVAAEQQPDMHLVVQTTDYAFARLLEPHGFQLSIALTRPPTHRG